MAQVALEKGYSTDIREDATPPEPVQRATPGFWSRLPTVLALLSGVFCAWYAYLFYDAISPYWFHKGWATDDSLQQVYPFHEVNYPGLFEGDLITEVMMGYLAPVHYWLCYGVTMLTGDPIMMSHWVMAIQIVLTVGFMFLAVRHAAGVVPAFLAVIWLLHTRNTMQRLTAGLPRGWSAPMFAAFMYFAISGNHVGVLITIFLGCLTNPPAAMVAAVAYGITLVWRIAASREAERKLYVRRLVSYAAVAPVFALVTLAVVHRPPSIGQMVTYDEAAQMPEFSRPGGRFPFIPLNPAIQEIRTVSLEACIGRFYNPPARLRTAMPYLVLGAFALMVAVGWFRRRKSVPPEVVAFGLAAFTVYCLSRQLAFKLYVPNRHLQIPMAMFFIAAFTIGIWRAFHLAPVAANDDGRSRYDSRLRTSWPAATAMVALGLLVWFGSSTGLIGAMNFNYATDKKGAVFAWLRQNTPTTALIAGQPTHIDATQLFAARRAYVTTETTHPFYTRYYAEMKRRYEISVKAHYSGSLREMVEILTPERIDYFVFKRGDFYPHKLPVLWEDYFTPIRSLVRELTVRPPDQYAYRQLPVSVDMDRFPFMPFRDRQSVVVDLKALTRYLEEHPEYGNVSVPVTDSYALPVSKPETSAARGDQQKRGV